MRHTLICVLLMLFVALAAAGQVEPGRTSVFRDLTVPAGHTWNDATCFFCSVYVVGAVNGDVTTEWGDIEVNGAISGDVTAVAGDIRLGTGAKIDGASVAVFGDMVLQPNARITGDAVAAIGRIEASPGAAFEKSKVEVPLGLVSRVSSRPRTFAFFWILGVAISLPSSFLCLALLRRKRLESLVSTMSARKWRTVLFGIFAFGSLVVATALSDDSKYDDWLQLLLLLLMLLLAAPGYTGLALRITKRFVSGSVTGALLGTLLLVTAQSIPILGWILGLVLMIVTLGASLASIGRVQPSVTSTAPQTSVSTP